MPWQNATQLSDFHATITAQAGLTVAEADSLHAAADAIPVGPPPPNMISIADANWFFSPYNWHKSGSTFAISNNPGAYMRLLVTGSDSIKLGVDVSALSGVPAEHYPTIAWKLDSGSWQRQQLTSGATEVVLGTGLGTGQHRLIVVFVGAYFTGFDRWLTPDMALKVTHLELDAAGALDPPAILPNRMLCFGDSHTEGYEILAAGISVANQDAGQAWPFMLARANEAEVGVVAFAGHGWTDGVPASNVPDFEDSWPWLYQGQARDLSQQPAHIVICHGDSETGDVQAAVQNVLTAMRAAAPTSQIVLVTPANRDSAAAIAAGFAAASDGNMKLVDHGFSMHWDYFHGSHLSVRGQAHFAVLIQKGMQ